MMTHTEIADKLEAYNRWRRSDDDESGTWGPDQSKELGRTIDAAVAALRAADAPVAFERRPNGVPGQLFTTALVMAEMASVLRYFGGFNAEQRDWADKLETASTIVNGWSKQLATRCTKCGGTMAPGKSLAQTSTGSPDELGGDVVTMSPGGPGKLIDCMKCAACGHSVSR